MTEGPPGGGDPWDREGDPFHDDPAAREREARRVERERRRAERAARDAGRPAGADAGPSAGERASAALSGLGERISRRRAEREREKDPLATEGPDPAPDDAEPARQRSEPHRFSRSTPPPGGRSLRDRLRRPSPVLIVAIIFLVAILLFANALFQPFHGDSGKAIAFEVAKGESAGEVADRLDEEGVVSSATLFEIRLTLAGHRSDIYAGDFKLNEGMSYSEAIDALTTPPSQRAKLVTVPEGYTREEIAKLSTKSGLKGSYEQASTSVKGFDPAKYGAEDAENLEGFLFPDSYELKAKATAEDLVADQLAAFEENFEKVDLDYAESQGLDAYDVLTIASLIDREVQVAKERELVSSVIYNRLDQGEPLAIDATLLYETGGKDITDAQLQGDSPYNTRTNQGLPPTPIGNPGLAAIQAAANPADTDYLFYVVKPGTCFEHEFNETLAEHNEADARYQEAYEEAGGKSPTEC